MHGPTGCRGDSSGFIEFFLAANEWAASSSAMHGAHADRKHALYPVSTVAHPSQSCRDVTLSGALYTSLPPPYPYPQDLGRYSNQTTHARRLSYWEQSQSGKILR